MDMQMLLWREQGLTYQENQAGYEFFTPEMIYYLVKAFTDLNIGQ